MFIGFLVCDKLPSNEQQARQIVEQALHFSVVDNVLYFVDSKSKGQKRSVVPIHLRKQIMEENHSSPMAGHFAYKQNVKLYKSLVGHW